MNFMY